MSNTTAILPATSNVTLDELVSLAQGLGTLASAINPAYAGAVAAATGIAQLIRTTVMPAIMHIQGGPMSVAEQAALAAESAIERARVGAPEAAVN